MWDLEAAMKPVLRAGNGGADEVGSDRGQVSTTAAGQGSAAGALAAADRPSLGANTAAPPAVNPASGYTPVSAKGHKESVYALAINDAGTVLVSGGTEKVKNQRLRLSTLLALLRVVESSSNRLFPKPGNTGMGSQNWSQANEVEGPCRQCPSFTFRFVRKVCSMLNIFCLVVPITLYI